MTVNYPGTTTILILSSLLASNAVLGDDELFDVAEFAVEGRAVSMAFADVDGDGRKDLLIASLDGLPPAETRKIQVHLQQASGTYPTSPSHVVDVPKSSAVYDIADLKDTPGEEIVLLRPDGISLLSIANAKVAQWNIPVTGPSTVAAFDDERGFDLYRLVYEFNEQPLILVPQIGLVSILSADSELIGQIEVGGRANYFVSRKSSVFSAESDLQLYLDTPKLSIGDVNGDARADVVAATRHEIRVFLGQADGTFNSEPSYSHALALLSQRDHSRGSGSVVTVGRDVDGDGLLDLVITHTDGTLSDTVTTTYFHRNQAGRWDLENPGETFVSDGAFSSDLLLDIDSDKTYELVRINFKFSILEVVEILLTRKIDSVVEVHRLLPSGRFDPKPSSRRKFSTGISFDTFRPKGFMPQTGIDINADGFMDIVTSANGKAIDVYLGTADEPFTRRTARQKMSTTGRIQFEDFDADGLLDFILYDSQSFDSPVQVGRNRGVLSQ